MPLLHRSKETNRSKEEKKQTDQESRIQTDLKNQTMKL